MGDSPANSSSIDGVKKRTALVAYHGTDSNLKVDLLAVYSNPSRRQRHPHRRGIIFGSAKDQQYTSMFAASHLFSATPQWSNPW